VPKHQIQIYLTGVPIPGTSLQIKGFGALVDGLAPGRSLVIGGSAKLASAGVDLLNINAGIRVNKDSASLTIAGEPLNGGEVPLVWDDPKPGLTVEKGGLTFLKANGQATLNWDRGTLALNGSVASVGDLLKGQTSFSIDKKLNFGMFGDFEAEPPKEIPLIGGIKLGRVGGGILFSNDNNYSNDYAAAWTKIGVEFEVGIGPFSKKIDLKKDVGARIYFDGKFGKFLGADDVEKLGTDLKTGVADIGSGSLLQGAAQNQIRSLSIPSDTNIASPSSQNGQVIQDPLLAVDQVGSGKFLGIQMDNQAVADGAIFYGAFYNSPQITQNTTGGLLAVDVTKVGKKIQALSNDKSSFYIVPLDPSFYKGVLHGDGYIQPVAVKDFSPSGDSISNALKDNSNGSIGIDLPEQGNVIRQGVINYADRGSHTPDSKFTLFEFSNDDPRLNMEAATKAVQEPTASPLPNASSLIDITYDASSSNTNPMVSLFYTKQKGQNGSSIAEDLVGQNGQNSYVWDTSSVPNGKYYIYAVVDDGVNAPEVRYLNQPVVIKQDGQKEQFGKTSTDRLNRLSTEQAMVGNMNDSLTNRHLQQSGKHHSLGQVNHAHMLVGTAKADVFGLGHDNFVQIKHFDINADRFHVSGASFDQLQIVQQGSNTLIEWNNKPIAQLNGVQAQSITKAAFV
jgi:hypothetical protein